MKLDATLHPRMSDDPASCDVMLALYGVKGAEPPQVAWTLAGKSHVPLEAQALGPALDPALVPKVGGAITHTGLYSFKGLALGREHEVVASVGGSVVASTHVRGRPATLPSAAEGGFHVLLASCYYQEQAKHAELRTTLRAAISELPYRSGLVGPDLALFMGDQVYLDLPLLENLPDDALGLQRAFEKKYAVNWRSSLGLLLGCAPGIHVSDDHEFWNNFPFASPIARNTRSGSGRARWTVAARRLLDRFQQITPHREFDVAPASFFVADGRTFRSTPSDDRGKPSEGSLARGDASWDHTLAQDSLGALSNWITRLNGTASLSTGIYVTGQSILSAPSADDAAPSNYRDYEPTLAALLRAEKPLILVTGDVHFGRATRMSHAARRASMFEVIVSPLASVKDQRLRLRDLLPRLVGMGWDRDWDSVPPEPPPSALGEPRAFRTQAFPASPVCKTLQLMRGDQLGVLSLTRTGNRVDAKITYWSVSARPKPVVVPLHDLISP